MQFRILGPLEVLSDTGPVSVGESRPRTLLAVLLIKRGVAVSTGRGLGNALSGLRAYLSRLRSVLGWR